MLRAASFWQACVVLSFTQDTLADSMARYGMEQNWDGLASAVGNKKGMKWIGYTVFDLCGLTAPCIEQIKTELTILVLRRTEQILVWEFFNIGGSWFVLLAVFVSSLQLKTNYQ